MRNNKEGVHCALSSGRIVTCLPLNVKPNWMWTPGCQIEVLLLATYGMFMGLVCFSVPIGIITVCFVVNLNLPPKNLWQIVVKTNHPLFLDLRSNKTEIRFVSVCFAVVSHRDQIGPKTPWPTAPWSSSSEGSWGGNPMARELVVLLFWEFRTKLCRIFLSWQLYKCMLKKNVGFTSHESWIFQSPWFRLELHRSHAKDLAYWTSGCIGHGSSIHKCKWTK